MGKTLIKITGLKKRFKIGAGEVLILKGLNLEIEAGEFVMIIGPSGCGKSTLLHCLLGLEEPSEGQVLMEDKDYYAMNEDERALYRRHKVGMIYQQSLWINSLRVADNVAFPLNLLNWDQEKIDARVKEVLEHVGMAEWGTYSPTELSSGQQQKINLARSLTIDPILIVADEPTGNLDTVSGIALLETLSGLQDKGVTIIMVTHDLEYLKYATKVFHMIDGEIVEEQTQKKGTIKAPVAGGTKAGDATETGDLTVRDKDYLKKLQQHPG